MGWGGDSAAVQSPPVLIGVTDVSYQVTVHICLEETRALVQRTLWGEGAQPRCRRMHRSPAGQGPACPKPPAPAWPQPYLSGVAHFRATITGVPNAILIPVCLQGVRHLGAVIQHVGNPCKGSPGWMPSFPPAWHESIPAL